MLLSKINCFPKGLSGFSALQNVRKIRDGNWNQLDSNSFDIRTFLHSGALEPTRQKVSTLATSLDPTFSKLRCGIQIRMVAGFAARSMAQGADFRSKPEE
jgi:hypothetical protein